MPTTRTDCHQHLWPAALVEALRSRAQPPRLDGWELQLDGEAPYAVDPADHDLEVRRAADAADGLGLTLLSLSSPLGIELLPAERVGAAARRLAREPGRPRRGPRALGGAPARGARPRRAGRDPGAARASGGLQVPATVMTTPAALEQVAPVLRVAEAAGLPVLVHPGPVGQPAPDVPSWWPALTDYPAQLASAWFAWHAAGRSLLPRLRIGFVALAGLAPLHHERLAQRGGRLGPLDPGVFYETSSYGRQAVDAMTRVVGADALVHGTDRPYAGPTDLALGPAFDHAVHVANPHHFLTGGTR